MNRAKKLISALLLSIIMIHADAPKTPHSIVITLQEYPILENIDELKTEHQITTVVQQPSKATAFRDRENLHKGHPKKKPHKNKTVPVSGIPIIYYGYITYSPVTGIVILPRMHENPDFSILLSTKINPIFMIRNTIHHFELAKGAEHAFYGVIKKYDEATKTHLWSVEKRTLPEDGHLPLETIIIFTEPDNCYLPEGISLTNDNAQAVLPVMYIKSDKNHTANGLAALEISYLFKSIDPIKKS